MSEEVEKRCDRIVEELKRYDVILDERGIESEGGLDSNNYFENVNLALNIYYKSIPSHLSAGLLDITEERILQFLTILCLRIHKEYAEKFYNFKVPIDESLAKEEILKQLNVEVTKVRSVGSMSLASKYHYKGTTEWHLNYNCPRHLSSSMINCYDIIYQLFLELVIEIDRDYKEYLKKNTIH
jgi:hypothetical protein